MGPSRHITIRYSRFAYPLVILLTFEWGACSDYHPTGLKYCANRTKVCVQSEQCLEGTINVEGISIIGPRSSDFDECNELGIVCCALPPGTRTYDPQWAGQCGQRMDGESTTKNETIRWEFPWSVAVFHVTKLLGLKRKEFLCGGTLIDDQVVLTAARCVQQRRLSGLLVQVGRWDLDVGQEEFMQESGVEKLIIHDKYSSSSQINNIALLFLNDSLHIGAASNRVCLPEVEQLGSDLWCYVVGWTNMPEANGLNQLLKLGSVYADRTDCRNSIRTSSRVHKFSLPEQHFCASYTDTPVPCERAPGSGMVCTLPDNVQFFLVGILSYALRNCSQFSAKDVFVSTSHHISWIDDHITKNNRYTNFYRPEPTK